MRINQCLAGTQDSGALYRSIKAYRALGKDVAVAVSRSDGPGSVVSAGARKEAKKGLII